MTEYELIDANISYAGEAAEAIAMYFSIVSAYLVMCYLVGAKLTRQQAVLVSGLFVLTASYLVMSITVWLTRSSEFVIELQQLNPERVFFNGPLLLTATPLLFGFGILASLKFMWDVRHPKNNSDDSE